MDYTDITARYANLVVEAEIVDNLSRDTADKLRKMLTNEIDSPWLYKDIFDEVAMSYLLGVYPGLGSAITAIRSKIEYRNSKEPKASIAVDDKTETK